MPCDRSDEAGSVILLTLMFILIITGMGLIATQTSIFEIKISENACRYCEECAGAEAALNDAIIKFRQQATVNTYDICRLLNDTRYNDYRNAVYVNDSPQIYPGMTGSLAKIEIRRIVKRETHLDCSDDGVDSGCDICDLSDQANDVPSLNHRYYAGSIDKRRFAITATAYKRNSQRLSTTWVQKGISLPAEPDTDIF